MYGYLKVWMLTGGGSSSTEQVCVICRGAQTGGARHGMKSATISECIFKVESAFSVFTKGRQVRFTKQRSPIKIFNKGRQQKSGSAFMIFQKVANKKSWEHIFN